VIACVCVLFSMASNLSMLSNALCVGLPVPLVSLAMASFCPPCSLTRAAPWHACSVLQSAQLLLPNLGIYVELLRRELELGMRPCPRLCRLASPGACGARPPAQGPASRDPEAAGGLARVGRCGGMRPSMPPLQLSSCLGLCTHSS